MATPHIMARQTVLQEPKAYWSTPLLPLQGTVGTAAGHRLTVGVHYQPAMDCTWGFLWCEGIPEVLSTTCRNVLAHTCPILRSSFNHLHHSGVDCGCSTTPAVVARHLLCRCDSQCIVHCIVHYSLAEAVSNVQTSFAHGITNDMLALSGLQCFTHV